MADPITFARICGVTVLCANDTVSREVERIEGNASTLVNTPINRRRGFRLTVSAATTPTTRARASALEGLINGHAHAFSYDTDFHSSRGKGPDDGVNATIITAAPTPKRGVGCANIDELTYDLAVDDDVVELADRWMWHGWKWDEVDTWEDVQVRSDGAVWVDGERDDTYPTTWLVVGFGTMSLTGVIVDDAAFFLFEPDDDMVAELHAWHVDNAWPSFGQLAVDGDIVEGRLLTCVGETADEAVVQFGTDDGWENAGRAIRFKLVQQDVDPPPLLRTPLALVYTDPAHMIVDSAGWYTAPAMAITGVIGSRTGPFGWPAGTFTSPAQIDFVGSETRFDIRTDAAMTIAAWVWLTTAIGGLQVIYAKGLPGTDVTPALFIDAAGAGFGWWDVAGVASGLDLRGAQDLPIGRWFLLCARYDGSRLAAGVDVVVDADSIPLAVFSDAAPAAPGLNNRLPSIGAANSNFFPMTADAGVEAVGVWNVRLTDAEVAELYRAGQRRRRPRFSPFGV